MNQVLYFRAFVLSKPILMKNTILFLAIVVMVFTFGSCKDAIEDGIDCVVETTYLSVDANVDQSSPLLVHFTFINGDTTGNRFTLDQNIKWEFGDGTEETTTGLTVSHLYPDLATYTAKAYYILRSGSSSCADYKSKSITLE